MRQLEAMVRTIKIAEGRGYEHQIYDDVEGVDYKHMVSMVDRATQGYMEETFSEAKLGRWLGYIQGVLVANEFITLEEAKAINKEYAD